MPHLRKRPESTLQIRIFECHTSPLLRERKRRSPCPPETTVFFIALAAIRPKVRFLLPAWSFDLAAANQTTRPSPGEAPIWEMGENIHQTPH